MRVPVPTIPTPSQTAGPFVYLGAGWLAVENMAGDDNAGAIEVSGSVIDGAGAPVTDAMIEFWQADEHGLFPPETAPGWKGFTRLFTDSGRQVQVGDAEAGHWGAGRRAR